MHNIIFIKYLKSVNKLFEDEQGVLLTDNSFFTKQSLESASIAILINKIKVIGSLKHVDILDNMFMFFNIGQYVDLVDCAFL